MEKQIAREHFTFARLEKRFPREHFGISLLLVSKSHFLASISLFLVSKSDFLAADQLSLRSPAAPVAGSFLYMPPRATAFTVLLLPPGDSMQGWSHRPRRPSLFLLRELDCVRRLFQELA